MVRIMAGEKITCQALRNCRQERRGNRRIAVRLSVSVRFLTAEGAPSGAERTVTRNISPHDMCFESGLAGQLTPGDRLEAEIELPVEGATIFAERRLQARGRIVRVESTVATGQAGAVAVIFEGPPVFHSANG